MSGSGWRGKLPLRMPSPGLRGAGELGAAFWVLPELCSWMAEGRGGGGSLGGPFPRLYPALQGRLMVKFGFPGFPWAPGVPEAHTREAGGSSDRPSNTTLKLPTCLQCPRTLKKTSLALPRVGWDAGK